MAETRLSNKSSAAGYKGKNHRKPLLEGISIFRILRFAFLLLLSILLVYIYYLYLKDSLQKTVLDLWKNHKKVIIPISIIIGYSVVIFQLGVWKGKRR